MLDIKDFKNYEKFLTSQTLSVIRHDLNNHITVLLNYLMFLEGNNEEIKTKLKNSVKEINTYLKEESIFNLKLKRKEKFEFKKFSDYFSKILDDVGINYSIKIDLDNKYFFFIDCELLSVLIYRLVSEIIPNSKEFDIYIKNINSEIYMKISSNIDINKEKIIKSFKSNENFGIYLIKRFLERKSIEVDVEENDLIFKIEEIEEG